MKRLWIILLACFLALAVVNQGLTADEYETALAQLGRNKDGEIARANKEFERADTQLKNGVLSGMDSVKEYRDTRISAAKQEYETSARDAGAMTRYNAAVDQAWEEYGRTRLKSENEYAEQYVKSRNQCNTRIAEANNQYEAAKSRIDRVKEKYAQQAAKPAPPPDYNNYNKASTQAEDRRAAAVDKAAKDFDNRVSKADKDLDDALNRAVENHRASGTGPESEAMYQRTRGMAILKNEDDYATARNKRDAELAKIEEHYKNETAAAKKKYNIDQPEPELTPEEREAYRKELAQAMAPQSQPPARPTETMQIPPKAELPAKTTEPLAAITTPTPTALANMSLDQIEGFLPGSVADAVFLKREDVLNTVTNKMTLRRVYGQPGQYGSYVEIHVDRGCAFLGEDKETTRQDFESAVANPSNLEPMRPNVQSYFVKRYDNYPVVVFIHQGGQGMTAFFDYSYFRFGVICSNRYNSMAYIDAGIQSLLNNLGLTK